MTRDNQSLVGFHLQWIGNSQIASEMVALGKQTQYNGAWIINYITATKEKGIERHTGIRNNTKTLEGHTNPDPNPFPTQPILNTMTTITEYTGEISLRHTHDPSR